jgi:enoyl-CoA hydratase
MPEESLVRRRSDEEGVEILTLAHPPVNALSTQLLADLRGRLDELDHLENVRALIVTGDGQYFSAGADLKEMARIGMDHAGRIVRDGQSLFTRLESFRSPVIACVNGLALGGALELAIACDLRVAADSAKFGAPEVGFGLMPAYGGTQRLPRLIGRSKARELIFTGGLIAAAEALRIGLVNKVVPAGQELRAARDIAHAIAQKAPRAVQAAKRAMEEGELRPIAEALEREAVAFEKDVLPSEDLGEGIAAFLEHRPPKFRGK